MRDQASAARQGRQAEVVVGGRPFWRNLLNPALVKAAERLFGVRKCQDESKNTTRDRRRTSIGQRSEKTKTDGGF